MGKRHIQYTLRGVPVQVDQVLRQRALREHRSLNEVTLQVLQQGLGVADDPVRRHDLNVFIGSWLTDPAFDEAVATLDQVDPLLWA